MTPTRHARGERTPVDRSSDRLVATASVGIALAFLALAAITAFLPPATRVGAWLPIHLALAGAASTVIAGVMPFFSAAFAMAQPAPARLRWAALLLVAAGSALVVVGYPLGQLTLAAAGGLTYLTGTVLVAVATVAPRRRALGPKGGPVTRGYLAALAMVLVGVTMTTLFLAGWQPVVEAWGRLRPVHPWLNLLGFVTLVVATTLLHFFPTVIGARIADVRSARVTVAALAVGVPLVAIGFALQADLVARLGALLVLWGGLALATYCWLTWRTRFRWTGDRGWHVFAMGGLVSGVVWFELGLLWAAGRVLAFGPDPGAFTTDVLIGPLVVGWVGLTILASATHLVPSVGPGHPIAHARQRQILGLGGSARLLTADAGIAAFSVGLPLRSDLLVLAGALLTAAALATTGALLAWAIVVGLRDPGMMGRPGHPGGPGAP